MFSIKVSTITSIYSTTTTPSPTPTPTPTPPLSLEKTLKRGIKEGHFIAYFIMIPSITKTTKYHEIGLLVYKRAC